MSDVISKTTNVEQQKMKYFSWYEVTSAIDELVSCIKKENIEFEEIWGIPRGGLIPGVMLSHIFDKPLNASKEMPSVRPLLIVDDIADSGNTLNKLLPKPQNKESSRKGITIVTIHYQKDSIIVPDIHVREKIDEWIVYPWESKQLVV